MPEIRVTRSAGTSWNTKYAPGVQNPPDQQTASLANIETVLKSVGPLGGPAVNGSLHTLTDVSLDNLSPGDVLRYADNKWRNYSETQLTDGGNF
jgi:hypothetical protein